MGVLRDEPLPLFAAAADKHADKIPEPAIALRPGNWRRCGRGLSRCQATAPADRGHNLLLTCTDRVEC